MKENRFVSWIRRHPVWSIVIALLFFIVVIPVLINLCYSCDHVFYVTQWGAKDVLSFYAAILGSTVTLIGLILTITITKKQIQRESFLNGELEKWKKIETLFSTILNEINPITVLNITFQVDARDPHEAITQIQQYQMCCRTAADKLVAYLSMLDYPRVAPLLDRIMKVSDDLFQIANTETAELSKYYLLNIAKASEKILRNISVNPNDVNTAEIEECKKAICNAAGITYEGILAAIGKQNDKLREIYETAYRELLQLKGQTFESIYAQIENDADAILHFGRKKECQPSNGSEKRK